MLIVKSPLFQPFQYHNSHTSIKGNEKKEKYWYYIILGADKGIFNGILNRLFRY